MSYDLAAIRARLDDPLAVATALGLIDGRRSYQRLARGLLVRCAAHSERTPSCSLASSGGDGVVWNCFGCGAGGGVFDLVAAVARLDVRADFRRVAELAAQLAGVAEGEAAPAFVPPPRPPEPPRLDDETFTAIAAVIATRCPVASAPDVAAYLAGRGFDATAAAELAALPPTPRGQAALIDAIVAEVGADAWRLSGLASERGGFVFPAHRLVAFWCGPDATVQTIQRRMVRPPRPDERVGKYIFTTRRSPRWPYGVEHAPALGPGGEVAFVEGFLDALALRSLCARAGADRLALGLPGTTWLRPWAQLARGRVAVVATDPDAAGDAAVEPIANDLLDAGAAAVRRETPDGAKDWSELLARGAHEVAA